MLSKIKSFFGSLFDNKRKFEHIEENIISEESTIVVPTISYQKILPNKELETVSEEIETTDESEMFDEIQVLEEVEILTENTDSESMSSSERSRLRHLGYF